MTKEKEDELMKRYADIVEELWRNGMSVVSCISNYNNPTPSFVTTVTLSSVSNHQIDHTVMDSITSISSVWHNMTHEGEKLQWVDGKQVR